MCSFYLSRKHSVEVGCPFDTSFWAHECLSLVDAYFICWFRISQALREKIWASILNIWSRAHSSFSSSPQAVVTPGQGCWCWRLALWLWASCFTCLGSDLFPFKVRWSHEAISQTCSSFNGLQAFLAKNRTEAEYILGEVGELLGSSSFIPIPGEDKRLCSLLSWHEFRIH